MGGYANSGDTPPETSVSHRPSTRRGPLRFVALFIILVLLQLTAYRYVTESTPNDWYLFQVARHTSWILGTVGNEARLEGETARSVGQPDVITPWERWRQRAERTRSASGQGAEIGPRVSFILRPGIHHQIQALEAKRQEMVNEAGTKDPERERLDTELKGLRQTLSDSLGDPERRAALQGWQFTFNVVPTCGAIEIMAIFLAAVVAFPASGRARAQGVAVGLPVLYVVNLCRLSCLAIIGALDHGGAWFTFIHEYVWQAIYVVFVVVLWLFWVGRLGRRPAP